MKRKLFLMLSVFCSLHFNAQHYEKLPISKNGPPIYLINNNIICNLETVPQILLKNIKKVEVIKPNGKAFNEYFNSLPNLTQYGIVNIEIDSKLIQTKSQDDIKFFLGFKPETRIYIDGFLLTNSTYLIATKSIKEIEVIEPNEQNQLSEKVLNIWTLSKENRIDSKMCSGLSISK